MKYLLMLVLLAGCGESISYPPLPMGTMCTVGGMDVIVIHTDDNIGEVYIAYKDIQDVKIHVHREMLECNIV